jgi:hypothetical protein
MNDRTDPKVDPPSALPEPKQAGFLSPFNQALADQARPVMRRIEELLPDIEEAFAKGYTRANIVAALKCEGIDISVETLSVYVQRLRQRRGRPPAPSAGNELAPTAPGSGTQDSPLANPTPKQSFGGTRS